MTIERTIEVPRPPDAHNTKGAKLAPIHVTPELTLILTLEYSEPEPVKEHYLMGC